MNTQIISRHLQRRRFFQFGLAGMALALARNASALKYYPQPATKKWAIVYGTWCGSSRDAAIWISEGMAGIADVFDIREKPDLKPFDHLVIGSSIRGGKVHPDLEKFLTENNDWIKAKVRGYWAICNNMGQTPGPQQKKTLIDDHLAKLCGVPDLPGKVFHGRITKELLDQQSLGMMRSFPDNDNLKRADCLAFGKEILAGTKS